MTTWACDNDFLEDDPKTGGLTKDVPVFAVQRAWAKCKLTDLQYLGGPHMTTEDHVCIFRVIAEVFGSPPMGVPEHANGEWGFKQWANHITHGRW